MHALQSNTLRKFIAHSITRNIFGIKIYVISAYFMLGLESRPYLLYFVPNDLLVCGLLNLKEDLIRIVTLLNS